MPKWLTPAALRNAVHPLVTLGVLALVLYGEPQCASALARLGLVPQADALLPVATVR